MITDFRRRLHPAVTVDDDAGDAVIVGPGRSPDQLGNFRSKRVRSRICRLGGIIGLDDFCLRRAVGHDGSTFLSRPHS